MRVEHHQYTPNKPFGGDGEIETLLRSYDWSQTPLGAVETWSDDLKTAAQILLTELEQVQLTPEKSQNHALHQANQLNAFRVKLAEALRPITDASEIQALAARILGESLGATRVIYIEVVSEGEEVVVRCNYTNGVASLSGRYRAEDYQRNLTADHEAGRTQVVTDIPNDSTYTDAQKKKYCEIDVAAHIDVPLIKNNRFVALLAAQQSTPRQWTETEVKLVEETAEQTWAAVERAYAEAALRQSEEQSRNILESITDAFLSIDKNWQVNYVNQTAYTLTGYAPGELIGKNFWEAFPGLPDSEFEQMHRRVMRDRVAESLTEFYPDHDRWYEVRTYPATNGITVYFRNVTEQMKAEEAVRRSEARFRRIFECNMIGMGTWTQSGSIAEANDALLDIIGYTQQELAEGRLSWQEITAPEHAERDQQALAAIAESGTCAPYEKDFIHKQGYRVPILVGATGFSDNPEAGFFFAVDLSDRKRAEAALQKSEELKQRILESSQDCIKVLTLEGRLIYLNAGGLDLLEIDDPTSVLNSKWFDFWQDEDRQNAEAAFVAAKAGSAGQFQGCCPTAKGNLKWWDVIVTPIQDASGMVAQLLSISRDITKQKQAELEQEQLLKREQAAREESERANRLKDEFLAVLSHELRSPLNPILGWTQLLKTGRFDQARQAEALATIERNAKLQSQLIEDLLDISRIMQGKLTLNPTHTSLTFVISAAVETVRLAAEAKNIEIALDLDAPVAPIFGDAGRLQQVVWNLLTNAVKFTPKGGQVTVELRQVEQLAQIRVIDTGIGIKAQFIPYVFEYFRQADGSTTRKFGGLGLGLAIVRQIVELHGGTVAVESGGEQQGATFIVQLPVLLKQSTPVLSESTQPQLNSETLLDNIQILLVDDDTDTREFQAFLLEQYGARVTAVASGLEALQALEQLIPDVIVSDIAMPEMDGYGLMQQIRSRPPAQGGTVPAIALTAYAAEIDQKRALEVGFQTHLTKPLEPERFVREIVTLLKPNRV